MEFLLTAAELVINLDQHLTDIIQSYREWALLLIFLTVFCETGLVVTPFLPGDSLLFVIGALGASGDINLLLFAVVITVAAVSGNMLNYHIGSFVGPRIFVKEDSRFFNREQLLKARDFYDKHGGKAVVISRFLPILRTFVPFVAGIGRMNYGRFFLYNLVGGILWVAVFFTGGFFFGNIPIVRNNLSLIILGIIVITVVPALITIVYNSRSRRKEDYS
ncbi:MAG: DedA family protein [Syntrophomonadaceae bacterium]|jgi:membrane-associated protein|nr:DedA family protein [Syntrophomonadaceae bacterium]